VAPVRWTCHPTAPDDWAVVIGDVVGKGAAAATLTSHAKAGAGFGAAKVGGYPVRSRGPFHVAVRATAREDVGPVVLDVASHGRALGGGVRALWGDDGRCGVIQPSTEMRCPRWDT
jgi:hypothetical protein